MNLRLFLISIFVFLCFGSVSHARDVKKEPEIEKLTYEDEDEILDQADIRGFIWGLPRSIIKEGEESVFVEESEGVLFFVDTIRKIKSSITYEFEEDRLHRVRIFNEKKYPDPQDRMQDFVKIKRDLVNRFGEPKEEKFQWLKDTDKKYPESWGWAVYRGELLITLTWENERSFVSAYLGSYNPYKPVMIVTYEDIKVKRAKAKQKAIEDIQIMP